MVRHWRNTLYCIIKLSCLASNVWLNRTRHEQDCKSNLLNDWGEVFLFGFLGLHGTNMQTIQIDAS